MSTTDNKSHFDMDDTKSHEPAGGETIITLMDSEKDPNKIAAAEDLVAAETQYTEEEYDKLKWKFELILLPCLMLTYGLQYADKVSLSSGVVFGLKTDTHLSSDEYSLLTVWFYLAYLAGQIPMSIVLQRLPLGRSLGMTIIAWGITVIGLGLCNNYTQLSVLRVMLGWFECSITPGFLLIIASWYKRKESTLRSCFFFAMNSLLGGVFNIIIYAIAKKSESGSTVAGWRAINYFLGSLTVLAGIIVFIFVGIPKDVFWLNKEQKKMAHVRIISNATGDGGNRAWDWAQVRECFKDPQYYFMILFNLMSTIPNGVLGTFSALVFKGFGFSALDSILYQLPANAIGFVVIISSALIVNYWPRTRFPISIFEIMVEMIVFLYVGLAKTAGKWQLWACFSFNGVVACPTFLIWSIMPLNCAGRTKKSFFSASAFISYCVGNMIGSQTMRPNDAPRYLHGLTASAIIMGADCILLSVWYLYYVRENKKREAAFVASGMSNEEREHLNKLAGELDQTDRQNPHFRYMC
ncbi:hypothetical protein CI109_102740 [Kwoniella shandongensis]|uniref:Major facilitator superfamily (MFS) profile domain-containing protein n=1 Tax=Kwoniella shandongensis TaxID=1734106 RepID=A0AAJ8MUT5_9TREE